MATFFQRLASGVALAALATAAAQSAPPQGGKKKPASSFGEMFAPARLPAALTVIDGVIDRGNELKGKITGGTITAERADGIHIRVDEDRAKGVYLKGLATQYTIANSTIDMYGNGGDFTSGPTGVVTEDHAELTLDHTKINTYGLASSALVSTGGSLLRVEHSLLHTTGGTVPPGYQQHPSRPWGVMMAPAPLGIWGSSRVQITAGHARAYYSDSEISSNYWGALSTDASGGDLYLQADRCKIFVSKSGYGAYADLGTEVVINDSLIDAATYGGIVAGTGSMTLNGTNITTKGVGVMIHATAGPGADPATQATLRIRGGSIHAGQQVLLMKGVNADVVLDGVAVTSDHGVLLQGIVNPFKFALDPGNTPVNGVRATLIDMQVTGAISNSDPKHGMSVSLIATKLASAVQNVALSIDRTSSWTATGNSNVTLTGATDVSNIDAPAGVTIAAGNGAKSTLKGRYRLKSGGTLTVND